METRQRFTIMQQCNQGPQAGFNVNDNVQFQLENQAWCTGVITYFIGTDFANVLTYSKTEAIVMIISVNNNTRNYTMSYSSSSTMTESFVNDMAYHGYTIGDNVEFYRKTGLTKGVITGFVSGDFANVRLDTEEELIVLIRILSLSPNLVDDEDC